MIVIINALSARMGGGQTYLLNLLRNIPSNLDITIYVFAPELLSRNVNDERVKFIQIDEKYITNQVLRLYWERIQLPTILKKYKADILFCPGGLINTNPPKGCKTVVTFQNMLPFDPKQIKTYNKLYERIRLRLLKILSLRSFREADLVIFISDYARNVINSFLNKEIKRQVTIRHGLSNIFRSVNGQAFSRPNWLPDCEYFLYVSTFEPYKGHLKLIKEFQTLKSKRETNEKLIFIGGKDNSTYGKEVNREVQLLGLENDISIISQISYEELPAVYYYAKLNIFASECENCPNILLEILGAGKPSIVSNIQPMPEIAGDAVIYYDPSCSGDFSDKVISLLNDEALQKNISKKALDKSLEYEWKATAELTWNEICKK